MKEKKLKISEKRLIQVIFDYVSKVSEQQWKNMDETGQKEVGQYINNTLTRTF